jgi:hypothetical protein
MLAKKKMLLMEKKNEYQNHNNTHRPDQQRGPGKQAFNEPQVSLYVFHN